MCPPGEQRPSTPCRHSERSSKEVDVEIGPTKFDFVVVLAKQGYLPLTPVPLLPALFRKRERVLAAAITNCHRERVR
jgi:hypothetical protein